MGRTGNRLAARYQNMAPIVSGPESMVLENEDQASKFFKVDIEKARALTELRIVIDGSNWTDYQDDIWAMALRAYAPLSNNLVHLQIIVTGSVLFTQFNYIKPVISTMVPFGIPVGDSDSESSTSDSPGSAQSGTPSGRNKKTQAMPSPTTFRNPITRYNKRVVPQEKLAFHLTGQKAIITALLGLAKPIPVITIEGPMEMAVRRNLIMALNPRWESSEHCQEQMGYDPNDCDAVEEAEKHEQEMMSTGTEMVRLRSSDSADDADDFHLTASARPTNWEVLTGIAGRQAYGWKTTTSAWMGPRRGGRRSMT